MHDLTPVVAHLKEHGFIPEYTNFFDKSNHGLMLDYKKLFAIAQERTQEYQAGEPFPHIVIDDFMSPETVDAVLDCFPSPDAQFDWNRDEYKADEKHMAQRGKLAHAGIALYEPAIRQIFWELNSAPILFFLAALTGIEGLVPDPHLLGGGLHQTVKGGSLRVHADFNVHPLFHLFRRLNIIIYLNKDWDESYGGHLELWEKDMSRCAKRILPVAGRCVIFNTTHDANHGHPRPLTCPEDRSRKSLALYYYTNGRPANEVQQAHDVLWQKMPDDLEEVMNSPN